MATKDTQTKTTNDSTDAKTAAATTGADAVTVPSSSGPPPVGTVLAEDDGYETVVVRRKKAAKPTGRFVTNGNYRCEVRTREAAEILRSEGANITEHKFDRDHHSRAGEVAFLVFLPAAGSYVGIEPPPELKRPGYTLPREVAEHGVACGALEPEKA